MAFHDESAYGLGAFASETKRVLGAAQSPALRRYGSGAGVMVVAVLAGVGWWRWMPAVSPPAAAQGVLRVESDPAGAEVRVDGVATGATPVVLSLRPGAHTLVVNRGQSRREATVTIEPGVRTVDHTTWVGAGATTAASRPVRAEPPVTPLSPPATRKPDTAGWVDASSPILLQVYEGGRFIGTTQSRRLRLPAGAHTLDFVSDPLGWRTQRTVRIAPQGLTAIAIDVPRVRLSINAAPWADVWIDGTHVGQTPLGDLLEPIGVHRVEFRHPQLGTKSATVTVSLSAAARVSVDMTAQ